jgi:hypothetical protein
MRSMSKMRYGRPASSSLDAGEDLVALRELAEE